ncbi:SAM pointed domain-containing Ets transcription factor-like isoform 1-T4 [Salvelinus alpinus]|uniref:SAM pointed domain-containing Ets transcription factor n=1 Tax=Salvelinus sp. IW2-2015 TaxID=2691554 RepID=UPI000CDF62D4|nr:SAM pointed domain-containing Ets transcription factor [Salvelinus alpinus]XP_023851684.1 SAM pointed domain-containing Ets transcription factor [Salvelinus alpinus]XP_023851685.1 SAM pointed domain-containing Ets transcription factor [Salvelinus alpinus]
MSSPGESISSEGSSPLFPSRLGLPESPMGDRTGAEAGMAWEMEDTKPCMEALEHRGLPGLHLSCFDMLFTEDSTWLVKVTEASSGQAGPVPLPITRTEHREEPEQCPVIDSQALGLSPGLEGQEEERSLEQVQSMVVGEVLKDIETACKLLNIIPDPIEWSSGNVQKWLLWTEHLYRLPQAGKAFQELTGKDLCAMSEEDFRQRSPQCGDTLHAHLDIWKSAAWMKERCSVGDSKITGGEELWLEADSSCSGQPIHLWQFLRELLLKPHNYGRCIRWLNKEKGIFKIEDSAHVARLWGLRKNRPAMNYDKLSRSIRQYYKKGIIRKPDVSQRLVYQFVHPV